MLLLTAYCLDHLFCYYRENPRQENSVQKQVLFSSPFEKFSVHNRADSMVGGVITNGSMLQQDHV